MDSFGRWLSDLRSAVTFYTRLPHGWLGAIEPDPEAPAADPAGTMRMAPAAGLVVGLAGAVTLWVAAMLTGSDLVGAALAVTATIIVTGALHEDGLADFADALGGDTAKQRLKIMADSSTGAYGAAALSLAILVRVALIAAIAASAGTTAAGLGLIAAHSVSRAAALWLPYSLPPARKSGAAVAFGRPDEQTLIQAALIALILAFVFAASGAGLVATLVALALSAAAAFAMTLLANRLIGGQTGDVSGATEQACEICFLLGLAIVAG